MNERLINALLTDGGFQMFALIGTAIVLLGAAAIIKAFGYLFHGPPCECEYDLDESEEEEN